MPIRPITITGTKVLHEKAKPVTEFNEELEILVTDMFDTMEAAPGVGLAAPQIGIDLQVFVYDWTDDDGVHHRGVAINPELELFGSQEFDPEEHIEGCLSVPGLRYPLNRQPLARLTAMDLNQNKYTEVAKGWLARIFQHEFDHLQGVLYVDRLDQQQKALALEDIKQQPWGPDGKWMPGIDYSEP